MWSFTIWCHPVTHMSRYLSICWASLSLCCKGHGHKTAKVKILCANLMHRNWLTHLCQPVVWCNVKARFSKMAAEMLCRNVLCTLLWRVVCSEHWRRWGLVWLWTIAVAAVHVWLLVLRVHWSWRDSAVELLTSCVSQCCGRCLHTLITSRHLTRASLRVNCLLTRQASHSTLKGCF